MVTRQSVRRLAGGGSVNLVEADGVDQDQQSSGRRDDRADEQTDGFGVDPADRPVTEHRSSRHAKRVLVVEDDESVSSLLVDLLEDRGFKAIPALDGQTAIELAREHQPDLITLDLALPGSDGHQVLASLKADPRTRDIPIVVISAFTQILPAGERKKLAYLLGKPFDVTEVLEVVQATVGNPYV